MAWVSARSRSWAETLVSTTSSRGMFWIPILTSTMLLYSVPARTLGESSCYPGLAPARGGCSAAARQATDTTPGQPGYELLRGVLGDGAVGAEPVCRADLGHPDQADTQQMRLVVVQPRVLTDELADHVRVHARARVEPVPDGGLVAQVRLEDQAERLPGAGDEVEERLEGGADPLLVVGRGGER